jgi:hypothetical protein
LGACEIGRPVVRAHNIRQPWAWARRQPSTRARSALSAATSTWTPSTSKLLVLSIGGMPRSAPSSWA